MKVKQFLPLVILTYLIGSVVSFYSYTLLASCICNYASTNLVPEVLITLSSFSISLSMVAALFLLTRAFKFKEHLRQILKHYTILILIFSIIGFISSIVGPLWMYGTLLSDAPFKGYSLLCLFFNLLLIVTCVSSLFYMKKKINLDKEKRVNSSRFGWITLFLSIYLYHAMNRCGALILSPLYVSWNNLNETFVFYVMLAMPTVFLQIYIADIIGLFTDHPIARLIDVIITILLNLGSFISVIVVGYGNSSFISSISTALPIERLITLPFELFIQFGLTVVLSTCILIFSIKCFIQYNIGNKFRLYKF